MSAELRVKKLRGSGGYVMAKVSDKQQMKGNLGGPDLFLAPVGRLDSESISKHFCNTCEKEFEGSPKIEFENPNEEVAENLILAEKGQYVCESCDGTIAEYREFKKHNEAEEIGNAKPLESSVQGTQQVPEAEPRPEPAVERPQGTVTQPDSTLLEKDKQSHTKVERPQGTVTQPDSATSVSSIEGRAVYDEDANKIGTAKQVGIDSTQSVMLIITKNDGTEGSIPWDSIKKIGEVVLLGNPNKDIQAREPRRCGDCGFSNKEGSKFCEECGTKLQ